MRIIHEALTFDDVLLEPAYSEVLPREVKLKTQLTRSLSLNIPIISAAMDTVTEARLAITLVRASVPFFLILMAAVLVITYWPALSLAFVR